jgi:hypothetical protein
MTTLFKLKKSRAGLSESYKCEIVLSKKFMKTCPDGFESTGVEFANEKWKALARTCPTGRVLLGLFEKYDGLQEFLHPTNVKKLGGIAKTRGQIKGHSKKTKTLRYAIIRYHHARRRSKVASVGSHKFLLFHSDRLHDVERILFDFRNSLWFLGVITISALRHNFAELF